MAINANSNAHRSDAILSLQELNIKIQQSLQKLQQEPIRTILQNALHDDKGLPDKELLTLASSTIDLLAEAETLLQPANLVLADHFLGYTNTRCLVAAVELQIADLLAKHGPLGIVELAAKAKAQPDRLRQILRPLYNNGIFTYRPDSGTYTNNHVSKLLLRDHWTQWHNWVDLYGNEYYDIARGIPGSVREGVERSGAQVNFDTDDDMFTYFNKQGWMPRLHRTLGGGAVAMSPGILEDYPWTEVAHKTVIDVGGGGGGFITSLLSRFPTMKGGIYDLEHVIKHARDLFSPDGQYAEFEAQVPRDKLIPGDFLEWAPPSEVYTIKWVLHDWNDEDSVTILRNIRKAIINNGPASRLIVLESILCDGRMGRLSRYGDINMMMTAKGQERTEAQWRSLAKQSGWKVNQIFPLRNAWVHAIELRP